MYLYRFAVLFLVLSLAACSGVGGPVATATPFPTPTLAPTPTPEMVTVARFEPGLCAFALPEDHVQGQDVDCGYLFVPENRNQLPSRAIRLAVGIFHPPGGATQPDPIVFLAGGPGASALEGLRYQFEDGFAPVLAAGRDLVVFDQRGVGRSRPALDCPAFDELSLDLLDRQVDGRTVSDGEAFELALAALLACGADLSQVADLTAYNTAASAADVNDLRLALGYDKVNLWGGSYGTRLALSVMRDYSEGLRSVVLDSVYPPDADLYLESPANVTRSFNRFFDSCTGNPVCNDSFPNLRTVFWDTVDRLNATPVQRTLTNTLTGEVYPAVMNGDVLIGLVFQWLYESEVRLLLPQLIYDTSRGDFGMADLFRSAMLAQSSVSSRGMTFSVQCNEEIPFSSPEAFERALADYPELAGFYKGSILGPLAYRVCEGWDSGQADPLENQPVVSSVPTLVMAGEFDPITPPAWGRRAAENLARGSFFEYPGVGHGASVRRGCPRDMLLAFLNDPTVPPDGACIAAMGQ
ncbi:MAG: alpha/beta fold hydrolase [Thermoflexales bacterium]|nr:alpha/beta fold hydrolase [Thermoflexales bacterium]